MRRILLVLFVCIPLISLQAQLYTDTVLVDFETGLQGVTTSGNGTIQVVPNPLKDAVNSSDNVLHFVGHDWAVVVIHFDSTQFRNYFAKIDLKLFLTRPATFNGHLYDGFAQPMDWHGNHSSSQVGRWLDINFDMPAPADMGYKAIWLRTGDSTDIYIDNVGFLKVAPGQVSMFDVSHVIAGKVDNPLDFSADVKMHWDNDSIYSLFTIHDDTIVNTGGTNYQQDNIEFYLDLNNSKHVHWPRNGPWVRAVDSTFDNGDYQLRLNPGQSFAANNVAKPAGPSIDAGYSTNYEITGYGYQYGLNIAWKALDPAFVPAIGKTIGADVNVSDADNQNVNDANRSQITWNSITPNLFNDPSQWGTLELRQGGLFVWLKDTTKPSAPTNLLAIVNKRDATISWDAAHDNTAIMKYIIYNGNDSVTSIDAKQTSNNYKFTSLSDGVYAIAVAAVDNSGNVSSHVSTDVTIPGSSAPGDTAFSISRVVFGSVNNPSDFSAYLKLKWDADSLYSTYVVTDDSVVNTGTNYQVDNIEMYLDLSNSKRVHYPRNGSYVMPVDSAFDSTDYQIRLVPGVPFATNNMIRPNGSSIDSGYFQAYTRTSNGYKFKFDIAWNALKSGFVPKPGDRIGIDALISDNDNAAAVNDANRNQITLYSYTDKPFNDPSLWGTFEFTSGGLMAEIPDSIPPSIPSSLTYDTTTKGTLVLKWDTASDNIAVLRYIIYDGSDSVASAYGLKTGNNYVYKGLSSGEHTLGVAAVDNSENKSEIIIVKVNISNVGINGTSLTSLNLSPNPFDNTLNISSKEILKSVNITNLSGQIIISKNINSDNILLDLSSLKSGFYLIKVESANAFEIRKIMKR